MGCLQQEKLGQVTRDTLTGLNALKAWKNDNPQSSHSSLQDTE